MQHRPALQDWLMAFAWPLIEAPPGGWVSLERELAHRQRSPPLAGNQAELPWWRLRSVLLDPEGLPEPLWGLSPRCQAAWLACSSVEVP